MFQKDKWPFTPIRLSEILSPEELTVIESGSCERLERPLTILDYDPYTGGFSNRIESIKEKERYGGFCRFLRDEEHVKGGDRACKEWDIKQAIISLQEFDKTRDPFRIFQCHMGLQDMTYVIRIKNIPVALIFSGQYYPPEGMDHVQNIVQRLGTGSYSHIKLGDTEREQLLALAQELPPMPVNARERLELEAKHIQNIAEAAFEQGKYQWEQEFLDKLRTSIGLGEVVDRDRMKNKLCHILELIRGFCRCEYAAFFASVQEGDTVLTPLASVGASATIAGNFPHFNWRKASLPMEAFDIRTWGLARWYRETGSRGIRGENSQYFAEAGCMIPMCLGDRYRGVLALGPFAQPVDLETEQRFLAEIASIAGSFALTVSEVLHLERERHRWKTTATLLTHQLRTGLTPIATQIGRAKSMASDGVASSEIGHIRDLLNSAEALSILLARGAGETLAGHVLQVEPEDLVFERYPLSVLVANCAIGYAEAARGKRRTLVVHSSIESLPQAEVDVGRLTIALGNLIDNAIKYSYPDTEVVIRSHLDLLSMKAPSALADAVVEVHDTGLAVPDKERERIFEQGTRGLTAAKMGHISGSGLGLWEARAVVEAHGGEIRVRSEPASAQRGKDRAYHVVFSVRIPIRG